MSTEELLPGFAAVSSITSHEGKHRAEVLVNDDGTMRAFPLLNVVGVAVRIEDGDEARVRLDLHHVDVEIRP